MHCHMSDDRYIQLALAARLRDFGYSAAMASEIAAGRKKPSLEKAVEIEAAIGIPASAWIKGEGVAGMLAVMQRSAK